MVCIDENNPRYAVKKTDKSSMECAIKEAIMLRSMNHVNVIKAERIVFDEDSSCRIWMPRLPRSLDDTLSEIKNRPLDMRDFLKIVMGIASGVHYVHDRNIIHCDIKPANILLTPDCTPVLCDFNIAKMNIGKVYFDGSVQTRPYRAPEVKFRKPRTKYDERVDIWSVGCVFYCLATGGRVIDDWGSDDTTLSVCRWLHLDDYSTRRERWNALRPATLVQIENAVSSYLDESPFFTRVIVHDKYKKTVRDHIIHIIAGCLMPNPKNRFTSQQLINCAFDLVSSCTEVGVEIPAKPAVSSARADRSALKRSRKKMTDMVNISGSVEADLLESCDVITQHYACALSSHVLKLYSLAKMSPPKTMSLDGYVPPALTEKNVRAACVYIICCLFDDDISSYIGKYLNERDLCYLVGKILHDVKYDVIGCCPDLFKI